jgi:hypothetical protein
LWMIGMGGAGAVIVKGIAEVVGRLAWDWSSRNLELCLVVSGIRRSFSAVVVACSTASSKSCLNTKRCELVWSYCSIHKKVL